VIVWRFSQHDSLDDIPDEVSRQSVDEGQLPPDWSRRVSVTRAWGDRWLREGETAVLVVRSVLVPETYNVLVNPRHANAAGIKQLAAMPYLSILCSCLATKRIARQAKNRPCGRALRELLGRLLPSCRVESKC
jgi:hypothetical protein